MNSIGLLEVIGTWLEPLQPVLDPDRRIDWTRLTTLARELDDVLRIHPIEPELLPGPQRSDRLRAVRAELAQRGVLDTGDQPALFALLAQFLCGYRDIDLRDAIGLGHGILIARHGEPAARRRWIPRLLAGELAGIAITEPHGGSNPAATRTSATAAADGTWLITGRKSWISRLTEAAVFVVFFRAPDGELAAAAIDASQPGLHRQVIPPAGLAGWTWGILDLDAAPVRPEDVLHGDGMALLRKHFAGYRPLVVATALGGAAAVFDTVTDALTARRAVGDVPRLRDSALVTIGRAHAQLSTALLGATAAARLAETGHRNAESWSAVMKAHGVDLANQAAADLVLLLGAAGFRGDGQMTKIRRDLGGLLYADGIHDSLYRAAGKHYTAPSDTAVAVSLHALESLPRSA
ncbi:acyl-CoA dehydrogenase family protein [Nocardia transvalensis]|uniref:acyl-CoA dehydrogenase family protein n=1 Tax=Nocardia transvalensis TaxID=37333 RepID=UPI001895DD40|nr:acyl-CoA dehydrogenase family protein [Nocardia transvalensis]MBF6333344.1 acyl-CoA dehydrogenase family protein [Nocardia transvalensis]